MTVHLHLFCSDRLRLKAGLTALVWLALCLCGNVWAASAIETWRNEAAAVRVLAENDAPAAYREVEHLQSTLPKDAMPSDRVRLLNLFSRIELYLALTDRAAMHAQQAFDLAKQHADKVGQVEADLNVALNAVYQGKLDAMVAATTDSMEVVGDVNRPDLLSESMLRTAMMYRRLGQLDDSVTMAMQTMEVAQHSNDSVALTYAHQGMAISFEQSGHLGEALEHYTQMRKQAQAAHMQHLEAESLIGVGGVISRLGDARGGERFIREAIEMHRKVGSPFRLTFGLFALAENLHRQGRTTASLPVLNEAVTIYEKYPNPIGLWWTLNARSTQNQSLGHIGAAGVDAERAYALAKSIGFPLYLSESAKRMAAVAAGRGEQRRAYELFIEADAMSAQAAQANASTRMLALAKRYESESKQRHIDELNLSNERQSSEIQKYTLRQRWLWSMFGGSMIVLVVIAIFLLRLRRAHHQLQQYQSHQQAILEAVPDMLFELGLDGRYYNCYSLHHPDLLVAPASALLGKTISEVMPQEAAAICLSAIQEAYEKGLSTGKQYSLLLPQGMCWFEISIARKSMRGGETPRFIGLARDITEHKQMEAALQESRQHFRDVFENASDALYLLEVTDDGRFRNLEINPALERSTGIAREVMIGKYVDEAVSEEAGRAVVDKYRRCVEAGIPIDEEFELNLPTGLRVYHSTLIPVFNEHGRIHRIAGVSRDITAQRQAELLVQQQLELKAQLARIAMIAPGVICTFQLVPGGIMRLVYASPRLEEVTGLSIEAQSRGIFHVIHPDDQDAYLDSILASVSTLSQWSNEFRMIHPNKGEIWLEVRCIPECQSDGEPFWHGFLQDITERKRLESRLIASELEFRTLTENSPDVVARFDSNCRYVYCNPTLQAVFGRSNAEVFGRTPTELFNGALSIRDFQEKIEEVLRSGREAELTLLVPNQNVSSIRKIYDHVRFMPEFGASGQVVSVLVVGRDISKLKEVERQLHTLVENLPDFVMRLDADGRYLYVSPAVSKAFSMPAEHYIGKTAVEVGITGDEVSDQALLNAALSCVREGIPSMLEMTFKHLYGDRVFDIIHVVERDEFGHIETVLAVARDITARKRAEEKLMRREQEFRTLAENTPDGIVRYDLECRRIYFNQAYIKANFFDAATVLGKTPREHFALHSPTAEEYIEHLQNIIKTGESNELLATLMDKNGLSIYRTITLVPELDERNQVISVLSISHDISEIKRMEAMLRKSELEFRTLAENSPEMIVRYDQNHRRIYINPAYEHYTGIRLQDALNKTPQEVWKPLMPREEYTSSLQRVMETGQRDQLLLEWNMPDGDLTSHLMHAVAEYDESGKVIGTLVIGHNISELKAAERLLKESQYVLRQLAVHNEAAREDERRYLAREIHDELGQYLMALRMGVSAIGLKYGENIPELQEKSDRIIEVVDATIQVVRNVVASLRPKSLDLGIVSALEWLADEHQARTETQCVLHISDDDIHLDDQRATVVFRIVQESLTNIGRHARASKVDIVLEQREHHYVVQVRDNGRGFDHTVRKDQSFGLIGMRERVFMLGGEVAITSAPDVGTVIEISIPINKVRSDEDA